MNEKKFCFISCVSDSQCEEEMLAYLDKIRVPEGYEKEQLSVREASSMAAGYNEAMAATDAKYKIYMHQDTFIMNTELLYDLLSLFKEDDIGMVGVAGTSKVPENGTWWSGPPHGRIISNEFTSMKDVIYSAQQKPYTEVQAVDGIFMATQKDLPWREDLFKAFHYYDASQCAEFRRKDYRIIIPYMEKPWLMHVGGAVTTPDYFSGFDESEEIYRREYRDLFPSD